MLGKQSGRGRIAESGHGIRDDCNGGFCGGVLQRFFCAIHEQVLVLGFGEISQLLAVQNFGERAQSYRGSTNDMVRVGMASGFVTTAYTATVLAKITTLHVPV